MLITKALLKQLCAVAAAGGVGAGGAAVAPRIVHAVKRPAVVRDLSRPAVAAVAAPVCAQGLEIAAVGDAVLLADATPASGGSGGGGGGGGAPGFGGFTPGGGFAPGGDFAAGGGGGGGFAPGGPLDPGVPGGGPGGEEPGGATPALPPGIPPAPATVPEPAAWLMMIIGFGLVGWAARRPRVAAGAPVC